MNTYEKWEELINSNKDKFKEQFLLNPKEEYLLEVYWNSASMSVVYLDKIDMQQKSYYIMIELWEKFLKEMEAKR